MTTEVTHPTSESTQLPKTLILMRHAKSDWGDSSLSDHDRPLNRRGLRDSPVMGQWLSAIGTVPNLVLCSSAARTQETVTQMQQGWPTQPQLSVLDSLYLASPETIWRTAASQGGQHDCVMLVAHNPGISQLASMMADQAMEMPTAAIAIFRFDIANWSELSSGTDAEFVQFMSPKLL